MITKPLIIYQDTLVHLIAQISRCTVCHMENHLLNLIMFHCVLIIVAVMESALMGHVNAFIIILVSIALLVSATLIVVVMVSASIIT